ncbi:MAG TPA: phosphate ABC transporter substrate-binding protein [Usitatibacter sp.]|nr:phosphate ABC transporter substrate-binding protein [Usitatibacter sp.]
MRFHRIAPVVLVALAALLPAVCAAELVVIVNPKNNATKLTPQQVALIFLGRAGSFPTGGAATPLDIREGSPLRDEFYARVAEKNPREVKAYWARLMFSGNGSPPRELPSAADVRRAVAADPTAIGYIDRATLDASVKEILTLR